MSELSKHSNLASGDNLTQVCHTETKFCKNIGSIYLK
jgi:hypothetical protein